MSQEAETTETVEEQDFSSDEEQDDSQTSEVADEDDSDVSEEEATTKDYKTEYESLQIALEKEREKNRKRSELERLQAAQNTSLPDKEEIGANELLQVAERRFQATLQQREFDNKEWGQAAKVYPELLDDSDLEDVVRSYRMNFMAKNGEYISYKDAADKVLSKFRKQTEQAKQDGYKAAKVSETTQKRANLDKPSAASEDSVGSEIEQLRKDAISNNKAVANRALERLIQLQGF